MGRGLGQLGVVGIRPYYQKGWLTIEEDLAGPKAQLTLVVPFSCRTEGGCVAPLWMILELIPSQGGWCLWLLIWRLFNQELLNCWIQDCWMQWVVESKFFKSKFVESKVCWIKNCWIWGMLNLRNVESKCVKSKFVESKDCWIWYFWTQGMLNPGFFCYPTWLNLRLLNPSFVEPMVVHPIFTASELALNL